MDDSGRNPPLRRPDNSDEVPIAVAAHDETDASEAEGSGPGADVQLGGTRKGHPFATLTDAAHAGTLPLQVSTRAVPSLDACSVYGTRREEAAVPHANRGRLLYRAPRPMQGFLWPSWFGESPFLDAHEKQSILRVGEQPIRSSPDSEALPLPTHDPCEKSPSTQPWAVASVIDMQQFETLHSLTWVDSAVC